MKYLATEEYAGMSAVVRTVTRWVSPFIILYGLYILSVAHENPGGAFESGVILACGFILLVLGHGEEAVVRVSRPLISAFVSVGALVFLILATGRMFFGSAFRLTGSVPLAEIGIAVEVMSALFMLLLSLSALRVKAGGTAEDFVTEIEE